MIQHLPKPFPRDKAVSRSINRVTESHIICRHAFSYCSSRASRLKKPACNLLPCPNLGKRAVILARKIDFLRFFVRRFLMSNFFMLVLGLPKGYCGQRIANERGRQVPHKKLPPVVPLVFLFWGNAPRHLRSELIRKQDHIDLHETRFPSPQSKHQAQQKVENRPQKRPVYAPSYPPPPSAPHLG